MKLGGVLGAGKDIHIIIDIRSQKILLHHNGCTKNQYLSIPSKGS